MEGSSTRPAGVDQSFTDKLEDCFNDVSSEFSTHGVNLRMGLDPYSERMKDIHELRNEHIDGIRRKGSDDPNVAKMSIQYISLACDYVREMAFARRIMIDSLKLFMNSKREYESLTNPRAAAFEPEAVNMADFLATRRLSGIEGDGGEQDRDVSKYTKLLLYIQFHLRNDDYRRYGENVYVRVVIDPNGRKLKTRAFKFYMSLSDFVYEKCSKAVNPYMWTIVAQPNDVVKSVVRYFCESNDPEFPSMKKNKSMFSFNNGVYRADTNDFCAYTSDDMPPADRFPDKAMPAKHFDLDFPVDKWREMHNRHIRDLREQYGSDEDLLERCNVKKDDDGDLYRCLDGKESGFPGIVLGYGYQPDGWGKRNEATGEYAGLKVEVLFTAQKITDPEVLRWMYVTVGRMMHDVGKFDQFGYVGMITGSAGNGKSTFCMYLTKMYDPDDVGVLSNNCEKKFALWAFSDKFIFIAPEVKADFSLDQAEWQGITTGDPMSIAGKFLKAMVKKWTTCGFFAGNQVPDWIDHGGSVLRRVLQWKFEDKPPTENANLLAEMLREMGEFILRSACEYIAAYKEARGGGIWERVPKYFRDNRDELTEKLNPLCNFLRSNKVRIDAEGANPQSAVSFDTFKKELKRHCVDSGFKTYRFANDSYKAMFSAHNLKVAVRKPYPRPPGRARKITCVVGCSLPEYDDEDGDDDDDGDMPEDDNDS